MSVYGASRFFEDFKVGGKISMFLEGYFRGAFDRGLYSGGGWQKWLFRPLGRLAPSVILYQT